MKDRMGKGKDGKKGERERKEESEESKTGIEGKEGRKTGSLEKKESEGGLVKVKEGKEEGRERK